MKRHRLLLTMVIMMITFMLMSSITYADEIIPSEVVSTQEDINLEEAKKDPTFSQELYLTSKNALSKEEREGRGYDEPKWYTWGSKGLASSTHLYYPIGYSAQRIGGVVQPTYHYTRTFLGNAANPRGDSGRVWGTYTVRANGTPCIEEVWLLMVHRVYYGVS